MMMPALAQHRGVTSTGDAPKRSRRTNEPFHTDALQEFGPFLLDPMNEQVRRGGQPVALTPRAFSVLSYLAAHANRLVTKNELLDHVWAGVFVGDAALKVCIREIRKALGDDPDAPQYIETAHRRGYRFIAPVFQRRRNREPSGRVLPAASPRAAEAPVEEYRTSESPCAEQSGTALRSGRQSGQMREIHYARSGDTNIAFQVLGDGPLDLVFVIIHRRGDRCLKVEEGRYVADRITGARFVELPEEDHLPFVGDQDALLDQIEEFVTGVRTRSEPDRVLATVLSAHIHGPARSRPGAAWRTPVDDYLAYARRQIQADRGRDLTAHVNGFVTAFDGPARAIRCATALSTAAAHLGIQVSVGLHTGECDALDDSIAGVAVEIGMQVSALAAVGEVLVSRTVTDLVAGSGIHFSDRGIHRLGGVAGEWRLFGVA
jgi:DNA-binding winged helix-turn-helix (wHTH) protein/class 3 adenylate cyclase